MSDTYAAKVLADSLSPDGVRLLTIQATFPRFILAEVNTHRMFSRNSASSRAIPTEKQIERVRINPFVPETFNKRVKGMGVGEAFSDEEFDAARTVWLKAADEACAAAEILNEMGLDKSRANRLLEPFLWHTAIISSTEWDNFFGLRDHPAAQPEFQIVARMMRAAIDASVPQRLEYGQWHLPLITEEELTDLCWIRQHQPDEINGRLWKLKMISAGRCARVSFDTHENWESWEKSIDRATMLAGNGHFSPFEHVARPIEPWDIDDDTIANVVSNSVRTQEVVGFEPDSAFCGNFRGWVQARAEIPHQSRFDLLRLEQEAAS